MLSDYAIANRSYAGYNASGAPNPLVVNVPGGDPTGQVFNGGSNFQINDGASHQGPARFIFATEAGIISGWNPNVPPASTQAFAGVDNSSSAIYKGLAIDSPTAGTKEPRKNNLNIYAMLSIVDAWIAWRKLQTNTKPFRLDWMKRRCGCGPPWKPVILVAVA